MKRRTGGGIGKRMGGRARRKRGRRRGGRRGVPLTPLTSVI